MFKIKVLKNAFQNIIRHKFISASTVFVIGLLIVIFDLALSLGGYAEEMIGQANSKVDMIVRLNSSAEGFAIDYFMSELKTQDQVAEATLLTPEQGVEIFSKTQPELFEGLQRYNIVELKDVFPYSVSIKIKTPEGRGEVKKYLEKRSDMIDQTSLSEDTANQSSAISATANNKLVSLVASVRGLFAVLLPMLILATLAISVNSVYLSLFTRQEEIMIMRLIGAKYKTIRLPYIYEGILLAVLALCAGNFVFFSLALVFGWSSALASLPLGTILFLQMVVILAVGGSASYIATESYLRQQKVLF